MFCGKCGTPNDDNNTTCVNCGAPMQRVQPQQTEFEQPVQAQNQQYGYAQPQYGYAQPQYGYAHPQQADKIMTAKKPKVLYLIAGIMAAIGFILPFLPSFKYDSVYYNVFNVGGKVFKKTSFSYLSKYKQTNYRSVEVNESFMYFFIVVMAVLAAWAVLSFLRKRPAGIFGVIAASLLVTAGALWFVMIDVSVKGAVYIEETPVPMLMVILGTAGIPVSIVQIVKKKYL